MKIDLGKNELIHFVGIGGIGMSGLAMIMNGLGYKVQGSDILGNRTVDWIYRIPNLNQEGDQRFRPKLWEWFQNANHGDNQDGTNNQNSNTQTFRTTAISDSKQGVRLAGARDGRGRWDNRSLTSIRISDNSGINYMRQGGFSKPTTSMWYYHAAQALLAAEVRAEDARRGHHGRDAARPRARRLE